MAGGYKSLLGFWAGGAGSKPEGHPDFGFRSLFAFWMGGATYKSTGPPVGSPGREAYQRAWERLQERRRNREYIHRDDEDMMEILTLYLGGVRL